MKVLNFFRKPYFVYLIGFVFLISSCKKNNENDENDNNYEFHTLTQQDLNDFNQKYPSLRDEITTYKNTHTDYDYMEVLNIVDQWYANEYGVNTVPLDFSKKQELIFIFEQIKDDNSSFDLNSYLINNNLYTSNELQILNDLYNQIQNSTDFISTLTIFENDIINSTSLSDLSKNKLLMNSQMLKLFNSIDQNIFLSTRRWSDCTSAIISAGVALVPLVAGGYLSGPLAAELTVDLFGLAGYNWALYKVATSCFD